jgi:hypothetical protein
VFSIAILLQYLASGFDWTDERRKFGEHALIGAGVLIAAAAALQVAAIRRAVPVEQLWLFPSAADR